MAKPKVLLLGSIDYVPEIWQALTPLADLITPHSTNREAFLAECQSEAFSTIKVIYRTASSVSTTGLFDAELIAALPKTILFCCSLGAGYDQIDIAACSARNPPLRVSNTPTAVDDATADTALFLILGALRGFNSGMQALRRGEWRGNPAPGLGRDPQGKVLGVLGMGGIGRNLLIVTPRMHKCTALGMTTIYHNRTALPSDVAAGAEYVSFDDLLARSDVLSLNLPLNPNTHHTLSHPEFARMKKGIIIINTARGAVIDEAALVAALASGQVASAGLDVFENEPKIHPELISNPNVMLLPHMGTYTTETMAAMEEWAISNVRMALDEGKLRSPVVEQRDL